MCGYECRARVVKIVLLACLLVIYRIVDYGHQQEGHADAEVPVQFLTPGDEVGIHPLLGKYELVRLDVEDRGEEQVDDCRGQQAIEGKDLGEEPVMQHL